MNIFNQYKSHVIASIGSLAFLGLLVLLLCIKPFGDSSSQSPEDMADQEMAIQFKQELMEDMPLPPPSDAQNTAEETAKQTQPAQTQPAPAATSDDVNNEPAEQEVSVMPANIDSVLIAELRKTLEEIKDIIPEDSLPKEQIQQKDTKQPKKVLADEAKNFYADRQFYYDNYRAILNLRKVYPYVLKTKETVDRMNQQLAKIKDQREKRLLIKKTEKELFSQFEKDVRNMSTTQGKLLLKLIARETSQSAYGLIKTYKGTIPATFWYGVGLIFNENLKMRYDSIGEDAQLEKVVQKYKQGKF